MSQDVRITGRRELEISFGEANPKQSLFYDSRTLYTAYGGARGGGKTHAVRIKAVGGALTWAGIKILIVRRTYASKSLKCQIDEVVTLEIDIYRFAAWAAGAGAKEALGALTKTNVLEYTDAQIAMMQAMGLR